MISLSELSRILSTEPLGVRRVWEESVLPSKQRGYFSLLKWVNLTASPHRGSLSLQYRIQLKIKPNIPAKYFNSHQKYNSIKLQIFLLKIQNKIILSTYAISAPFQKDKKTAFV